jgi:hypothetical protein
LDPEVWLCANMSSFTIGIKEETELKGNIYPVPAKDLITVQLETPVKNGVLAIYDLSGRVVYNLTVGDGQLFSIPVQTLSQGSYLLELRFDQKILRKKFVKN